MPLAATEVPLNFMGIGAMEMAIIFLVAFLVLGPSKSIEMAKAAGKVMRDIRRTFSDVAAAASVDVKETSSPVRNSSPKDSVPQDLSPKPAPKPAPEPEGREDQEMNELPEAKNE
jgi:sec-independent protein translocase protein TatB